MHDCAFAYVSIVLAIAVAVLAMRYHRPNRRIAELSETIDDAPNGILILDRDGTIEQANRSFCELVGYDEISVPGRPLRQFTEDPRVVDELLESLRSDASRPIQVEIALRGRIRERIETICFVRPQRRRSSSVRYSVSIEDKTERMRMVRSLSERTNLLNAMLSASRDGMMLIEVSGRVAYANQSFADLFGFDHDMLVGETVAGLLRRATEHSREMRDALERVFGDGSLTDRESVLPFRVTLTVATTRTVTLTTLPVRAASGEFVGRLVVARDVSPEENARRSRDQFLGNVSHELRTPLTNISGFVELLRRGRLGPLSERQRETLQTVSDNVTRLTALVSDLLAVGEFEEEAPRYEAFDLSALLRNCVAFESENAKQKGLDLSLDAPQSLEMEGDQERIRQLFGNLISNAVKYTPHGKVRVAVASVSDDAVALTVSDTGIGIDADDVPRLFVRFFRADNPETRRVRGTGLGLSIAKVVTDQHGGRITVDSRRGLGSTFKVELPRRKGRALPAAVGSPTPQVARKNRLVLAVDDDTLAHRIIVAALKGCGIDVMCAETGQRGIDLAVAQQPDVVLVDLELPDMAGSFVIECLRRDPGLARTPIVVISGRAPPPNIQELSNTWYLRKPVRSEKLREEVLRVLGDESIVCEVLPDDAKGVI